MLQFLFGLFVILHGLVHLWYVTLSQGWVKIKPGMPEPSWTGKSWLLTGILGDGATHALASILFSVAAIALVVSGINIISRADWWPKVLIISALFSSAVILLLWDGSLQLPVQKGLIGFLISTVIVLGLLLRKGPAFAL